MAAADMFGLGNLSTLSGPQQDTARTILNAFANSAAQRDRALARYPALLQTSGPLLSEFANDQAMKEATTASTLLNQNQQIQNMIDASHATPHGIMQNLAAYLPALAGLQGWIPTLFGRQAASNFMNQGLIGTVKSWFTGPDGTKYGLTSDGKVVYTSPSGQTTVGEANQAGWPGDTTQPNTSGFQGYTNDTFGYVPPPDTALNYTPVPDNFNIGNISDTASNVASNIPSDFSGFGTF